MAHSNQPPSIKKPKLSLTEKELAERWAVSIKTLQDWRRKGTGPAYLKLGKAIRYPDEIVKKHEAEHMVGDAQ